MKIRLEADKIWREYQEGLAYKEGLDLFDTVQQCEDFFVGDQWKGCEAKDLDKPVMNILRRVVTFFVASIVSDDIGISLETFDRDPAAQPVLRMLEDQLDQVMENAKLRAKLRQAIRDAAVDGDCCLHYWFDTEASQGRLKGNLDETPGEIRAELLENYNVFFGNAQSPEVERQPWIILRYRMDLTEARQLARSQGVEEWESIQPDEQERGVNTEYEKGKVTVLRKYWKENGTVHHTEVCRQCVLRKPAETGYRRYPLVWMPWEKVKNQFHGKGAIAGLIPNQIFINKLYAMAMRHVMMCAFPKIAYNRAMLPGGWTNRVGEAIPVQGDPNVAIGQGLRVPDMSAQVLQMIQQVAQDTRDTMGASDASLGNIKPDNTSAIVATQKATAMPLELQKMAFYELVEDSVRIWLEMMRENYGLRYVRLGQDEQGQDLVTLFDFAGLEELDLKLNVDIGASTYWSEIMQVNTMDNLFRSGIVTDPVLYLESIPKGYIRNQGELIRQVKQEKQQAEMLAGMQAMGQTGGAPAT